jgi:hypothetical protein
MHKPDGEPWTVREQIVRDKVTGLTFVFETAPGANAPYRLEIHGDCLPLGNRALFFTKEGEYDGGGTATTDTCRPTYRDLVDD